MACRLHGISGLARADFIMRQRDDDKMRDEFGRPDHLAGRDVSKRVNELKRVN
jgi:hypothetical protein